jgi:menaquinone-dependent protoporphyrinogen IX oxidase
MKGIIIYKGKYGATQQYAEWLGVELNLSVASADEIKGGELGKYDFLLMGTSVYIGKLQIQKWLKINLPFIKGKKIFLFQVAGTAPEQKEKRQAYNLSCIPKELINQCEFYFLTGRMLMSKLSWMDRFLLKMGARLAKDPDDRKSMLKDYDDVRKENILEITAAVRKFLRPAAVPA